jgi:hypothetical protein
MHIHTFSHSHAWTAQRLHRSILQWTWHSQQRGTEYPHPHVRLTLNHLYITTSIDALPDQENSWPGSATSGIGNTISGRFCTLGGGVPILCPSGNGDILGAIGCSTGTSHQDEAAAKAGRDAVLALIHKEKTDEARRVENERQAVLRLWKEKEEEVGTLRDELERGSKRIRLDEFSGGRKGSIALSNCGSVSGRSGMGLAPDTPPEEGEILPSFVGEVSLGRA